MDFPGVTKDLVEQALQSIDPEKIPPKNAGKVNQLKEIIKLCNIDMEIESEKDVGFDEKVEETGTTFEENSKIKAEALKNASKVEEGQIVIPKVVK